MLWDFQTTFPRPTEAALQELCAGIHFPDPDDEEAQFWNWHETAKWWVALVEGGKAARQAAVAIRQTGMLPGGQRLKDPEKHAKACEQDARNDRRSAADLLGEIEGIYGREVARAFRRHCIEHTGLFEEEAQPVEAGTQLSLF